MKPITLILCVAVGLLATSDMIHGSAMRHWRDGQAGPGMNLLITASRVNPLNFSVRLDQIESLYTGFRQTGNLAYLREAVVIARSLTENYPGNAQGWDIYSTALIHEFVHCGSDYYPLGEAAKASNMDPISVSSAENMMFLLAASRGDYELFKTIGKKRSRLTQAPLRMRCELCGRPWLDHRRKK